MAWEEGGGGGRRGGEGGDDAPPPAADHDLEKQGGGEMGKATEAATAEKEKPSGGLIGSILAVRAGEVYEVRPPERNPLWYQRLLDSGFEENGVKPVPLELRTSRQYDNLFTVFFTSLMNLLPIPTGMLAPLSFGLGLRDASLVILFFGMLTSIPPAFLGIGGMRTGMRQLVQARYSFGLYFVTIPLLLNAATVTGFCLVSAIIAGQTIASLNPAQVSVKVGIVIISLVSFAVSFMGFRVLHAWERWTWIPNLVSLLIAVGCGGGSLHLQSVFPPASAPQVMSYGALIAGFFLTYSGTASDYSIYHDPRGVSKLRIFLYIYLGILLPAVPLLVLGAAIGGAVPQVASWSAAYDATGAGGVMLEMLAPAGGFGKFVLVLLALSVVGNITMSVYSVSLNLQMVLPVFARVPRLFFVLVVIAVMIPFAIRAAEAWQDSLDNFLSVIGYWAACFAAVMLVEHAAFRPTYDHAAWNVAARLPPGVAAIAASLVSVALIVPGMAEVWYTGPIAAVTGDIGFEVAFAVTALAYFPFRLLEIRLCRWLELRRRDLK